MRRTYDQGIATRVPLTRDGIVAASLAIVDAEGTDRLTTTRVAQALGVSQPALYSHFRNRDALRGAVAMHGADELSRRVRTALEGLPPGGSRDAALLTMAHAYRDYVRQHPNRYLLQLSALRTEEYLTATEHAAEAVREVLRRYNLDEAQVRTAHTAFRAGVHGFAHLEANAAIPVPGRTADADFDFFVGLFAGGLAHPPKP